MRTRTLGVFVFVAAAITAAGITRADTPLGTAFTYQGRLLDQGSAANGNYTLHFTLFDAASVGNQIGSTQTLANVGVQQGLFTVTLDFGPNVINATTAERYLEISVGNTTLTPRQRLSPAPYALGVRLPMNQSVVSNGTALQITNNGTGSAIIGTAFANTGYGVRGESTANGGIGVHGQGGSINGIGVMGQVFATGDGVYGVGTNGVHGLDFTSSGNAGFGEATGGAIGVKGSTTSPTNPAVSGVNSDAGPGVSGTSTATGVVGTGTTGVQGTGSGTGVVGTGTTGVQGTASGPAGYGVRAINSANGGTALYATGGNGAYGVFSTAAGNGYGVYGSGYFGVFGNTTAAGHGVFGQATDGVGVGGQAYTSGVGVEGVSGSGPGVSGSSNSGIGVKGIGSSQAGVYGQSTSASGVYAVSTSGDGVTATTGGSNGVYAASTANGGNGIYAECNNGQSAYGVWGHSASGYGVVGQTDSASGAGGYFSNSAGGLALDVNGKARCTILEILGGADLAENFECSEPAEPGTVVAIDPERPGKLCISRRAYNANVAGVVSGANRLNAGVVLSDGPGADKSRPIALNGRVWVRCDAGNAAIEPGNLLTTADKPGFAMRALDSARAQGAILGKAMTSLKKGSTGLVLVLVNLQ